MIISVDYGSMTELDSEERFHRMLDADRYFISTYGRIYDDKRKGFVRPRIEGKAWAVSCVKNNGRSTRISPAREVFRTFVRPFIKSEVVKHKDGDTSNCKLDNLISDRSRAMFIDLTGQTFGRLTVLEVRDDMKKCYKNRSIRWKCRCSCGEVTTVSSNALRTNDIVSCGCYHREIELSKKKNRGFGEVPDRYWGEVKNGAKRRKLSVDITAEDAHIVFLKQDRKCALSGEPIFFGKHNGKRLAGGTASLDRIDSSRGYCVDNIQWLHVDINRMKLAYANEYFVQTCIKIANHSQKCKTEK